MRKDLKYYIIDKIKIKTGDNVIKIIHIKIDQKKDVFFQVMICYEYFNSTLFCHFHPEKNKNYGQRFCNFTEPEWKSILRVSKIKKIFI